MTHPNAFERVSLALQASHQAGEVTPECPDDDAIAALADGSLEAHRRAELVPHLAGCTRCRGLLASVARALADPAVAREAARLDRPAHHTTRRIARFALPLAAAGLIVMLSWPPALNQNESIHRAPTITTLPAPAPQSPIGAVTDARFMEWSQVIGADLYRVTVFAEDGAVVYEAEQGETSLRIPTSVRLERGRAYLWKVEARTDLGRWTASELVEFVIDGRETP